MTPEEERYFDEKEAIQALLDAKEADAEILWNGVKAIASRLFT